MHSTVRCVFALALLVSTIAGAADEASAPPSPPKPPTQDTKVSGKLPTDLEGRWLVMTWLELPQERTQTTGAMFDVTRAGDRLVATKRFVNFPPAQQTAVDAVNHEGKAHWQPTADDLKQIAAQWETLTPFDPYLSSVTTEFVGEDAFDDTIKSDERSKGAKWLLRTVENFRSAPEVHSIRQVSAFPVMDKRDDGYVATYSGLHLAAAPLPVPITLHGTAQFYRIAGVPSPPPAAPAPVATATTIPAPAAPAKPAPPPPPPPQKGLLARVLDIFSGCGKH